MRPRDGLTYVFAKINQASSDVFALAMNGIIVGERDPTKALRISWSYLIQVLQAGFGTMVLF
jgi:hypothetical protein